MLGEVCERLVDNGYSVIPLIPGEKRPGQPVGNKGDWRGMRGWEHFCSHLPSPYHVKSYQRPLYADAGVGLACGELLTAVDIDVRHQDAADEIAALAREMLGDGPTRFGAAPKRAILYRPMGALAKLSGGAFVMPGDETGAKPHRVEVLGHGNQLVAYGIHPETKRPYKWTDESPLDRSQDRLPLVTEERLRAFLAAVDAVPERHGGRRVASSSASDSGDHIPAGSLRGTLEAIGDALRWIPNPDLPYDDWVRVGLAVKGAMGDAGEGLWMSWSAQAGKNDPATTEKTWRGFRPMRIGAGTIYSAAQQHGWRPAPELHLDGSTDWEPGHHPAQPFLDRVAAMFAAGEFEPPPAANEGGATPCDTSATPPLRVAAPRLAATPFVWRDPSTIPPREWVYGRHLIRRFVSLTVAPGATGKSSLLIGDALAMVTGRPLLGEPVHEGPKRVWIWNLEDPRDEIERRVAATMVAHRVAPRDLADRLFIDSGRTNPLCIAEQALRGATILKPVVEALVAELVRQEIDVLIVDPFVSSHAAAENDNMAMDAVTKAWGVVADRAGCAIELVHHLRKSNGFEATAESARGAVSLVAAARSVRVLNRMTGEEAQKAGLDSPRRHFRVFDDKNNLAPPSAASDWFEMRSVDLANGDSVGVVVAWKWPDALDGVTVGDLLTVQHAIDGKGLRASIQAKDWVGHEVGRALGVDTADADGKAKVKGMLVEWMRSGALVATEVRGDDRHTRPVVEVGVWATSDGSAPRVRAA